MDLRTVPATPQLWDDVVQVFGVRGDPSWCWCQCFVTTGSGYTESAEANRRALEEQLGSDTAPHGVLAYADDEPVGWVQVGPREMFPRVTGNRVLSRTLARAGVDSTESEGVWRTTCFVVRVGHRRKGVARALLQSAVETARDQGASFLEGHPVDVAARASRPGGAELFHGTLSMFHDAGFTEMGRTYPTRPVVRLAL